MPYYETKAGLKLFYTIDGPVDAKDHILLVHGWTCDSLDWIFQIPFLKSLGLRVVAPDLRGHGHSTTPAENRYYTSDVLAGDLAEMLHALDINQTIVMAHSMGAKNVAASLSTNPHFSSLITAVVLIDVIYNHLAFGSEELKQTIEMFKSEKANEFTAELLVGPDMVGSETPDWLCTWHARRTLAMDPGVIGDCWRDAHEKPNIGLTEFAIEGWNMRKVPWLVVTTTSERADFFRQMDRRHGDQVVVFGDGKCGHWLHKERPGEFNALLKSWLKERGLLPT